MHSTHSQEKSDPYIWRYEWKQIGGRTLDYKLYNSDGHEGDSIKFWTPYYLPQGEAIERFGFQLTVYDKEGAHAEAVFPLEIIRYPGDNHVSDNPCGDHVKSGYYMDWRDELLYDWSFDDILDDLRILLRPPPDPK